MYVSGCHVRTGDFRCRLVHAWGCRLTRVDAIAAEDANGKLWLEITNVDPNQTVDVEASLAGITAKSASGQTLTAPKVDSVNSIEAQTR